MFKQNEIEKLIKPELYKVASYQPVEPTDILSKRIGIDANDIIKIDANENPYGCSSRVRKALAKFQNYHLYPDPQQHELRKELEKYIGLDSEYIITGSGSDELIELILRLFIEPGNKVINCPPTFGMYTFYTSLCGGNIVNIPRKSRFAIDLNVIKKAIDKNTKVIFIASPNNPTGNLINESEIKELLNYKILVVIDEAYIEFGGNSLVNEVPNHSNLLVLRTFSKWAGLAGLRIGYGIFPKYIISHLMKIKQPYNVNIAAQIAAIESLKDIYYLQRTIRKIIKERDRLFLLLKEITWLQVYESQSNFILCKVRKGNAEDIHHNLQNKGIFIRYYNSPELRNYIRISIGKPEYSDKLIYTLKELGHK